MRVINQPLSFKGTRRGQRGDTIVEVLIATAIVSLVLASAYALTNKNVRATQEVQEQSYAQKLVEQQVELLRIADPKPTADACFDPSTGNPSLLPSTTCQPKVGNVDYNVAVTRVLGTTYRVRVTWEALGGKTAQVTVYYRVAT